MVQRSKRGHGLEPASWGKVSQWLVCILLPACQTVATACSKQRSECQTEPQDGVQVLQNIRVSPKVTEGCGGSPPSPKGCYFYKLAARSSWEALSFPPCLASVHLTPGMLSQTNQRKHDTSGLHNKCRELCKSTTP